MVPYRSLLTSQQDWHWQQQQQQQQQPCELGRAYRTIRLNQCESRGIGEVLENTDADVLEQEPKGDSANDGPAVEAF